MAGKKLLVTWHPQSGMESDGCMLLRFLSPLLQSRIPAQGMVPPTVQSLIVVNVIDIIFGSHAQQQSFR